MATETGLKRLSEGTPHAELVDHEVAAVDHTVDGLLMAPSFAIPRLLARHGLDRARDAQIFAVLARFHFHGCAIEVRRVTPHDLEYRLCEAGARRAHDLERELTRVLD